MEKEAIGLCPVCTEKLIATKLTCNNCKLDLVGDFNLNKFSYLTKEELDYVTLFLQSEGSYKEVQAELGITYLRAKQILSDILFKLGLKDKKEVLSKKDIENRVAIEFVTIKESDHFIVKLIKEKLNDNKGVALINLITDGKKVKIWFDDDGSGLECDKIPVAKQLTWEVFIAAYNIAISQDGELYKGYARAGKLGSDKLPINSLEGYIAHEVHGVSEGKSAYSPGFIIAAILDWIGVFINERGSFLNLVSKNVFVKSYEDTLMNAKTFISGLDSSAGIKDRLNYFRQWYYFEELDSFAPSKFVGYKQMDMKVYQKVFNTSLDGKDTERVLRTFFTIAEGSYKEELKQKLENFLGKYHKEPNALSQIHIKRNNA